jgi:hypothetical protein
VTVFGITQGMPKNVGTRTRKKKKWDIVGRDHSNITAVCWKDERGRFVTLICS